MRNLRQRYTYKERLEFQDTITVLRDFLLPLLLERQDFACARCEEPSPRYEIDHLVYNPMVSINELQALCPPCHRAITDYTTLKNKAIRTKRERLQRLYEASPLLPQRPSA